MANSLHGPGPGTDSGPGGDQAEKRDCPRCGETVKNLGVHLRYDCTGIDA